MPVLSTSTPQWPSTRSPMTKVASGFSDAIWSITVLRPERYESFIAFGSPSCQNGLWLTSPTSALRKSGCDTTVRNAGSAAAEVLGAAETGDDGASTSGTDRDRAPAMAA